VTNTQPVYTSSNYVSGGSGIGGSTYVSQPATTTYVNQPATTYTTTEYVNQPVSNTYTTTYTTTTMIAILCIKTPLFCNKIFGLICLGVIFPLH